MAPIMKYGLATNSIGYLVTDDNAMVWRGPMASKALLQMLQETLWPDLDYLVLDMPPGTGDIQLTLAQNIPVTGAVVVTTPQDIALIDAKKGIVMFEKVEVPVLGIVENMSMHICSNCGHHEPIFGTGGAQKLAEKYHTSCWASCRCILRCVKIWITARRRWWRVRTANLPKSTASWRAVAAQMYWQGK
jgi:ATP-binding protein involved in chromosome partitioning